MDEIVRCNCRERVGGLVSEITRPNVSKRHWYDGLGINPIPCMGADMSINPIHLIANFGCGVTDLDLERICDIQTKTRHSVVMVSNNI